MRGYFIRREDAHDIFAQKKIVTCTFVTKYSIYLTKYEQSIIGENLTPYLPIKEIFDFIDLIRLDNALSNIRHVLPIMRQRYDCCVNAQI